MNIARKLKRVIAGLTVLSFFLAGILAVNFYMSEMGHEMLVGCPYTEDSSSMCPMNLGDHLGIWKQNFTSFIPELSKILIVSLFLAFTPVALLVLFIRYFPLIRYLGDFENKNLHFKLFDWILLSLRRGILEPKIYAEVKILA